MRQAHGWQTCQRLGGVWVRLNLDYVNFRLHSGTGANLFLRSTYWIEVYISSPLASKASLCRSIFFIVRLASSDPSPQVYLLNQDAASLSPLGYHLSDQYYQWPYLAGDVSGISPILWYESYSSLRAFRCCQNSYSITSTTESSQFRHASLRYLWPSRSSSLQWTGHRSLCLKIASLVENSR